MFNHIRLIRHLTIKTYITFLFILFILLLCHSISVQKIYNSHHIMHLVTTSNFCICYHSFLKNKSKKREKNSNSVIKILVEPYNIFYKNIIIYI